MEFNIEIRKKQLKSLKQYIKSSEDNVHAVLHSLGWSTKKTLEAEDPKVICPINNNHLINFKTSEAHVTKCKLSCSGYELKEEFLSEPPVNIYSSGIKLDKVKKIEILNTARSNNMGFKANWNGHELDPMTSDRLTSTFSTDERLTLYDYCIKHTKAPPKPEEFTLELPKKQLSEKEKLSLERDAKRRRVKYKSVHTSKKNQTEIMKEVIDNQMELYVQWIKQKQKQEKKEKEEKETAVREKSSETNSYVDQYQQNGQYHYIETTYQSQTQSNMGQWNQPVQSAEQHTGMYANQYYGNVTANQGVITDWSHLYQGVVDTDIYTEYDQCQSKNKEHTETPVPTETSQMYSGNHHLNFISDNCNKYSVEKDTNSYGGFTNGNTYDFSLDKQLLQFKEKVVDKTDKKQSSRSRENDRKNEREGRRHSSRERKYNRERKK